MKNRFLVIVLIFAVLAGSGIYYFKFVKTVDIHKEHREEKQLYTCPMHPQIISDRPGSCPICGMDLVPIKKLEESKESAPANLSNVSLMPDMAQKLGIVYEKVSVRDIVKEIKTAAEISVDETRVHKISPKIDGWIEKLYLNQTGQYVKKGEPLLAVYSQELLSAQEEYLSALKAEERFNKQENIKNTITSLRLAAKERLKLFDMNVSDIEELEKTRIPKKSVIIYSPFSGYLMEKTVNEGQKVASTDVLMSIADLSTVWGEINIYQPDLPYVKVGSKVKIIIPYWQNKSYSAKVVLINPFLNPETRTVKARIEIENHDLGLKPKMFADASISFVLPKRVAVPESAVIKSGTRDYVFVKVKDNELKPVIVQTGMLSSDGYLEVISGLKQGDEVVTSANFLIDSESQLKAAFKAATVGKSEQTAPTGHEGHVR